MALASWAEKLTGRRVQKCRCRLLLSSPPSICSSPKPPEVVLAANLRCTKCQKRVADTISRIDGFADVESIVVHVLEKKVTVTHQAFSHGSSTKIAAIYNELSRKASRISQPSSFVD